MQSHKTKFWKHFCSMIMVGKYILHYWVNHKILSLCIYTGDDKFV